MEVKVKNKKMKKKRKGAKTKVIDHLKKHLKQEFFTPNSFSFQDILRDEGFIYISYFPL